MTSSLIIPAERSSATSSLLLRSPPPSPDGRNYFSSTGIGAALTRSTATDLGRVPCGIEHYELGSKIGEGGESCAIVYRARILATGAEVALKVIDKRRISADRTGAATERLRREVGTESPELWAMMSRFVTQSPHARSGVGVRATRRVVPESSALADKRDDDARGADHHPAARLSATPRHRRALVRWAVSAGGCACGGVYDGPCVGGLRGCGCGGRTARHRSRHSRALRTRTSSRCSATGRMTTPSTLRSRCESKQEEERSPSSSSVALRRHRSTQRMPSACHPRDARAP